jgi:poly-gamma-glutamate synthesis protein (capsule biosynthesis protein)
MKSNRLGFLILTIIVLMLSACGGKTAEGLQETAQPAVQETAVVEEAQAELLALWLAPYLPAGLTAQLALPDQVFEVSEQVDADLIIDVSADHPLTQWVYALVAPFDTITDEFSLLDLQALWRGNVEQGAPVSHLILDGSTKGVFEKLWGSASLETVQVVSTDELLATARDVKNVWAIIPFEEVEPQWKVIAVDGQSPIQKTFNMNAYGLIVPFSIVGEAGPASEFEREYGPDSSQPVLPAVNRDADKLTTVILTGVTALSRGTAYLMEANGMTYPAIDIGDILREADILHINNEVSFSESCPNPFANEYNDDNQIFCSKPEYIQLLEAVGTDVVELAGDHFMDWGEEAMYYTLDMYDQRDWPYYGGGANISDGMKPILFEHNSNKIAFVGCNAKPPGYGQASADAPGAVHCDMQAMDAKVKDLIANGYLPIFTFQHIEYYKYTISDALVEDFHLAADAGAVIVSGSQAHMPHGFEFYKGAMLHYGLGNLFFDQYFESFPQRQAFLDRHVFYDGRYISTELISIIFTDMARPRLMTEEERVDLLNTVFAASAW